MINIPFSFTLFSFMNCSLVDFLLTRLQVLQSEMESLIAWTTVFQCHNKVEGKGSKKSKVQEKCECL
jgi:hypothetical protein